MVCLVNTGLRKKDLVYFETAVTPIIKPDFASPEGLQNVVLQVIIVSIF